MSARALVVSIHDVSPATRKPVAQILSALARIGVARTSLLVVPDYHHRGNIDTDGGFKKWLADLVGAGHEPVLHGYYHERERTRGESARTRLFTQFYTADEGEFFDIGYRHARELMQRGRAELAQCAGREPAGFIAPAWLLSSAAEEAAREVGFVYTTRLKTVVNLGSGRVEQSQSLCWSVRSGWRRSISLAWNRRLASKLHIAQLLRVSIHPPDAAHRKIWEQIQLLTDQAAKSREVMTYAGYIGRNG